MVGRLRCYESPPVYASRSLISGTSGLARTISTTLRNCSRKTNMKMVFGVRRTGVSNAPIYKPTPSRQPAFEQESRTLFLQALRDHPDDTLRIVRTHVHHTTSDDVGRGGNGSRDGPGQSGGQHVYGQPVFHAEIVENQGFKDIVRNKLAGVHDDCSDLA